MRNHQHEACSAPRAPAGSIAAGPCCSLPRLDRTERAPQYRGPRALSAAVRLLTTGVRSFSVCCNPTYPAIRSERVHKTEHDRDQHHRVRDPGQLTGVAECRRCRRPSGRCKPQFLYQRRENLVAQGHLIVGRRVRRAPCIRRRNIFWAQQLVPHSGDWNSRVATAHPATLTRSPIARWLKASSAAGIGSSTQPRL